MSIPDQVILEIKNAMTNSIKEYTTYEISLSEQASDKNRTLTSVRQRIALYELLKARYDPSLSTQMRNKVISRANKEMKDVLKMKASLDDVLLHIISGGHDGYLLNHPESLQMRYILSESYLHEYELLVDEYIQKRNSSVQETNIYN